MVTKPTHGQTDWDLTANPAFDDLQSQITAEALTARTAEAALAAAIVDGDASGVNSVAGLDGDVSANNLKNALALPTSTVAQLSALSGRLDTNDTDIDSLESDLSAEVARAVAAEADLQDQIDGIGGVAVESVAGETGVVTAAELKTALSLPSDTAGDLTALDADLTSEAALARNADNLTSGTVADARIASTIARDSEVTSAIAAQHTADQAEFAADADLTAEAALARNADNLTSGTVADARIASTIARDSEVTSAVATEETARIAADALKRDKFSLKGIPLWLYGNSMAKDNAATEYFELAATELAAGADTSYGVDGSRSPHTLSSMISTGTLTGNSAPASGALWPGVSSRQGVVIIDALFNDIAHYSGAVPGAISGAGGTRYLNAIKNIYTAMLAMASSQTRLESETSKTGSWFDGQSAAYASGGTYDYTVSAGATRTHTIAAADIPQTGPLAGRVWLEMFQFDPGTLANTDITYTIDGGAPITWTKTEWETYGTCTAIHAVIPVQLPADGAAHTVVFTHAGSGGQAFTADSIICASDNPGPILVMAPPPIAVGTFDAAGVAVYNANRQKIEPKIREAVALFPNAIYVPSTVTVEGLDTDGIHLAALGQQQRANDVVEALNSHYGAYMRSHESGDTILPWLPAKVSKADVDLGNVDNTSDATKNAATATLTNKTIALGGNTVTGTKAEFNTAMTDADFATLTGTETLTNKTVALGSNTVSGTLAQFNTAVTDADLASLAGTETLTNKRITKRVFSTADTATLTIDSDSYDGAKVTALAQAMTIAAPTGTPTDFQPLLIRIKDNGTARALTWNAAFAPHATLPTTTVLSKTVTIGCHWDSAASKWNVLAVTQEP